MRVMITGASRGLGFSMAKNALERGYEVIATYRGDQKDLKSIATDKLFPLEMDVTDADSVLRAAAAVQTKFEYIDCLISNAAILLGRYHFVETVDIEDIRQCMEVNVYGALRVIQAFIPFVYKSKNGTFINISSESGGLINTRQDDYPYCISKAAFNMISEKMHKYLLEKSISVFAVHPGWMHTDMGGERAPLDPNEVAGNILDLMDGTTPMEDHNPAYVDRFGKPMPL